MKTWQHTLFGIILGLTLSAAILLIISTPKSDGINLIFAPTSNLYEVHITGEVNKPGVYFIDRNSRIIDVIQAAGGFTMAANQNAINQADFVQDGSMIIIPSVSNKPNDLLTTSTIIPPDQIQSNKININTANQTEFENLPGIGSTKAAEIISYRLKNGNFLSIEDIMNVPGIGSTTFEEMKDLITVE